MQRTFTPANNMIKSPPKEVPRRRLLEMDKEVHDESSSEGTFADRYAERFTRPDRRGMRRAIGKMREREALRSMLGALGVGEEGR